MRVLSLEFKDYNDFVKKYGPIVSEKPVSTAFTMVAMYCEAIGVLLNRKLVDVGLVTDLLAVEMFWEKMKPIIEGARKQFNEPRFYEWFEYLYNEVHKREQRLRPELKPTYAKT